MSIKARDLVVYGDAVAAKEDEMILGFLFFKYLTKLKYLN